MCQEPVLAIFNVFSALRNQTTVFALDEIIMAFMNVLQVHMNILKNLRNFCKMLQGRRKYPALKPLKSKSDRLVFSSCSLARPSTSTHHKCTWPVPSPPGGNREEEWRVRGGCGE